MNIRRTSANSWPLSSTNRLHFAGGRNYGGGTIVDDDDIVFVAFLEPPLAADQRRLGDVLGRERRHAGTVPLHVTDDRVEVRVSDRFDGGLGVAALWGALEHVNGDFE